MKNWHLLMTKPREEERAESHLLNQNYEVFRPQLRYFKLKYGRQISVLESLFPRYIFIRIEEDRGNWSKIGATRGVSHIVRFDKYPVVVPDQVVEGIKNMADDKDIIDRTGKEGELFKPGQRVLVNEGCFSGLEAMVKRQLGEERVVIFLNMLGRRQCVTLPISQLSHL